MTDEYNKTSRNMGGTDEHERKQSHGVLALSVSKKMTKDLLPPKAAEVLFYGREQK